MKQALNFIPLIFFFVFLMLYDIFAGVTALVITATIAFILTWLIYKKVEKMELFSFLMIVFFGGLTLYFRNADFIKWKVTLINLLFALILLISQLLFKKNLLQKFLGKEIVLDANKWNTLNMIWVIFFIVSAMVSLYVTYHASDEFFGIFKAFILPGASLVVMLISGVYIYQKAEKNNTNHS